MDKKSYLCISFVWKMTFSLNQTGKVFSSNVTIKTFL